MLVLLTIIVGLTVLAAPASAATIASTTTEACDQLTAEEIDDLASSQLDDTTSYAESVTGEKEPATESGASVALLIDRSRAYNVNPSRAAGSSGTFGPWWCGTRGELRCSATLIDPEWVLTAAHCVSSAIQAPTGTHGVMHRGIEVFSLFARTDSVDALDGGQLTSVVETWVHPDWSMRVDPDGSWVTDYWNMRNDLALLRLAEPVDVTPAGFFSPPDLNELQQAPLFASGWGFTSTGIFARLHTWTTSVVDPAACDDRDGTGSFDPETMLCTDESDGSGTCLGDSGGSLGFVDEAGDHHVLAVTGFVMFPINAQTCDQPRLASFTRLTPEHHEWISSVINPDQLN